VRVFVDTSALFALLNSKDAMRRPASSAWTQLAQRREDLITSNYVVVEAMALIGRRLGFPAMRAFHDDLVPLLNILWVEARLHQRALAALLTAAMRDLSLVDCTSFEIMRQGGITTAFAYDNHFVQQGFAVISQVG